MEGKVIFIYVNGEILGKIVFSKLQLVFYKIFFGIKMIFNREIEFD